MIPRRFLLALLALSLSFAAPAGLVHAQDEAADEAKPKPKKKPAKKKGFDYDRSKYKSKEPPQTSTYKFNEKGEPVVEKKKAPAKKKKRSEPPEEDVKPESCGGEASCIEKKSEADAL